MLYSPVEDEEEEEEDEDEGYSSGDSADVGVVGVEGSLSEHIWRTITSACAAGTAGGVA